MRQSRRGSLWKVSGDTVRTGERADRLTAFICHLHPYEHKGTVNSRKEIIL